MVDQLSVRSHEIDIAAVPERDLIEQLFQTVIADIDQKARPVPWRNPP